MLELNSISGHGMVSCFTFLLISLGLSIGRNLFWGLGLARVVDLVYGFGFGFGFGFAPIPLALLWQSLGCGFSSCLGSG